MDETTEQNLGTTQFVTGDEHFEFWTFSGNVSFGMQHACYQSLSQFLGPPPPLQSGHSIPKTTGSRKTRTLSSFNSHCWKFHNEITLSSASGRAT